MIYPLNSYPSPKVLAFMAKRMEEAKRPAKPQVPPPYDAKRAVSKE